MIDIKNKRCQFHNCNKRPSFNYKGENKAIFCNKHKADNMIDIISKRCQFPNCDTQPYFNYKGENKAIFCNLHKQANMINIIRKKCKTYLCDIQVTKKYKGYCLRCFIYMFPNEKVARNYKTKEIAVIEYIKKEFQDLTIITDKNVQDGCSNRRPDILIDLGYQVLIIEIDENQHTNYDCSCNNKRTMQLSQDIGHRALIILRFNPDKYKTINGIVNSCWKPTKSGINIVPKHKIQEWNNRLETLKETICYYLENNINKLIEVIELFYDSN